MATSRAETLISVSPKVIRVCKEEGGCRRRGVVNGRGERDGEKWRVERKCKWRVKGSERAMEMGMMDHG